MNLVNSIGLVLSASLLSSAAQAHQDHAQVQPSASLAVQEVKGGSTLDARSYFTDTLLLNQDGQEVRFYSDVLAGRVVLLNVIFTSCEDACPLITRKLKEVRDALGEDASRVHFVSLSSDPEHDSPQALKAYARKHSADDPNWTFLTGPKDQLDVVLGRLGQLSRSPQEHSTQLIAGDVATKRWSKIRPDAPVQAIAQRLQLLSEPVAGR